MFIEKVGLRAERLYLPSRYAFHMESGMIEIRIKQGGADASLNGESRGMPWGKQYTSF